MDHFSTILLPSPVGHHYYTLFYVLAFLLNQALLLWEGHRRGYPLRPWLLLTAGATFAFIIGTKLIAIPAVEWPALWQHGQWPVGTARSVLGGAIGGTLAIMALRRWLGFGWHVFDAFAIPMCAAYTLQCFGCLLTGCCFGHVAEWGVQYAPGTLPYLEQLQRGLLAPTAAHSLPVLPTQLFTAFGALATGVTLWLLRHRPWPGGTWRLLHLVLLLGGRFVIEFWRDPAGEQVGATLHSVGGLTLKQVQWSLLPLVLVFLGWWWWAVRHAAGRVLAPETIPANQPLRNLAGVAGLLLAAAALGPGALTLPETLVVKAALTVVLALEVAALLRHGAAQPRRLGLPLGLASVVLLFTNQVPADSTSTGRRVSLTVSPGIMSGTYFEDKTIESGGCSGGGPATRVVYDHRHQVQGADVELNVVGESRDEFTFGLGYWAGSDRIRFRHINPTGPFVVGPAESSSSRSLHDIHPYFGWQTNPQHTGLRVQYRVGIHLGNLSNYQTGGENSLQKVKPELMVRLSYLNDIHLQADAGYGLLGVGNYTVRLGAGTGFGLKGGSNVTVGLAGAENKQGSKGGVMGFTSARIYLGKTGFMLEPYYAGNFDRMHQLSLRLHYRLALTKAQR